MKTSPKTRREALKQIGLCGAAGVAVASGIGTSCVGEEAPFPMTPPIGDDLPEWNRHFVEPEMSPVDRSGFPPASYLRKEIDLPAGWVAATLHLSALGLYVAYVNGHRVGTELFTPGFTDYRYHLQVQRYDVSELLVAGANTLAAVLGDGWYRSQLGLQNKRFVYGEKVAFFAALSVDYPDGSRAETLTDGTWKATQEGPLRCTDMKAGESYDARARLPGWNRSGFDDSSWHPVAHRSVAAELLPASAPPVREHEEFAARKIQEKDGAVILDFGQNLAGYVAFEVDGPPGREMVLRHGETLDEDGRFTVDHLGVDGRFQEVRYVLGEGAHAYRPSFCYSGFRYVEVTGWPGQLDPAAFRAVAVYSDLADVGSFACSNPLIDRLVENARWSQRSNYVDVPTDCPTRERGTWTGDFVAYFKAGCFLMDSRDFAEKWLADLLVSQRDDGLVRTHVPVQGYESYERLQGSTGWCDAATIIPWQHYQTYGDAGVLERHYPSMRRWVGYLRDRARRTHWLNRLRSVPLGDYVLDSGFHYGEWNEPGSVMAVRMTKNLIKSDAEFATAYFAHSTDLTARSARLLGRDGEAEELGALFGKVREAYRRNFTVDGVVAAGPDHKYVRPLALGLLDGDAAVATAARLNDRITASGFRIGTGFMSTPHLLPVLSRYGYSATAYRVLENVDPPSWLYAVTRGATTVWEHWDGIDVDGEPRDSLNHYAYGAVVGWLFEYCAGIRADRPGYEALRIAPEIGGTLSRVECRFASPVGDIRVCWERERERVGLVVEVPRAATVDLPDGTRRAVGPGAHEFSCGASPIEGPSAI